MKPVCVVVAAVAALSFVDATPSGAAGPAAVSDTIVPSADPFNISKELQIKIRTAQVACRCFFSVTPLEVVPSGTPDEVFHSIDVLFAAVGQDIQLPWVAAGEINPGALANLLGNQAGLINQLAAAAEDPTGVFHLGAYQWSRETQPDACSGETLYYMYFETTRILFVFRFDSSSEC